MTDMYYDQFPRYIGKVIPTITDKPKRHQFSYLLMFIIHPKPMIPLTQKSYGFKTAHSETGDYPNPSGAMAPRSTIIAKRHRIGSQNHFSDRLSPFPIPEILVDF
jgi:hypothetical protein